MFAAAGGASLAKRQARRNVRNKQHAHQHPVPVELHPHPPAPRHLQVQHLQPRLSTASAHHLYRAPSHRRLSSYADLNGRIVGFGSIELAEEPQDQQQEQQQGACSVPCRRGLGGAEGCREGCRRP